MDNKRFEFIDDVKWNKLPKEHQQLKINHTNTNRKINRINKRLLKIESERLELIKERRLLKRDKTELYNKLQYVNKHYNPKCYVVLDKGIYYNLIIKHLSKPKTIYLGKPQSIIKKLDKHLPNLTYKSVKKFEYTLNTFFDDTIKNNMNYNKPTLNINKLSDILNMI